MAWLNDPDVVRAEYASEARFLARSSIYAGAAGIDARDVIVEQIAAVEPGATLEVGCGPGELAARLGDEHGIAVRAIDISPRMVELARARGIDAAVGDVEALPFADASFDCVIAAWILYHVSDLDRGLSEIARVLRPGERLIAATNGQRHLEELWALVGVDRHASSFNTENGKPIIDRHFVQVEQHEVEGPVTFADRDAVRAYVAASPALAGPQPAELVPELQGPFRATRRNCVFFASKASPIIRRATTR